MLNNLGLIIKEASNFISSEFNLKIQKSKLKVYSNEDWKKFCQVNGFEVNGGGLYVPQSYIAYVNECNPVLVSNIFHELFSHGLFCEHSQIGKKLVDLIQEDKNSKGFLCDDIDSRIQPLGLTNKNIENYEGFAFWLEALLCKETNYKKIWESKKERLPEEDVALFEYFKDSEKKLTRFGFMSQLGFPKEYTNGKIIDVLNHFYNHNFVNINFIVLYGSKKPEKDIDLFIVSNNPSQDYFNGWLDIYELNMEEFRQRLGNFDISVTDPLFSGTLIYGDKSYFKQMKQKIKNQPITQESIEYNIKQAEQQKEYLPSFNSFPRERKSCLSYIKSFSRNAEELQKGNKALTLKNLLI